MCLCVVEYYFCVFLIELYVLMRCIWVFEVIYEYVVVELKLLVINIYIFKIWKKKLFKI